MSECPICNRNCSYRKNDADIIEVECDYCGGKFEISEEAQDKIKSWSEEDKLKIMAFITEKNLHQGIQPRILEDINTSRDQSSLVFSLDDIKRAFPAVPDVFDKILMNLYKKIPKPGAAYDKKWDYANPSKKYPLFYSTDQQELFFYLSAMKQDGLIDCNGPISETPIKITPKGFVRISELMRVSNEYSKYVFVALDFKHKDVYYDVIKPLLIEHGYEPICLLDSSRSENIDFEIANGIRKSRFVIADLTNQNSGVYWEAGMAFGADLPVILCCNSSDDIKPSDLVHFDLSHYRICFYKNFDELKITLPQWVEFYGQG